MKRIHVAFAYCLNSAPGFTISSTQYGGAWVSSGTLVESVYGGTPAGTYGVVNCRYQGDRYEWTLVGSRYLGTIRWLNPQQRRAAAQ
jgi:hypothetical protein